MLRNKYLSVALSIYISYILIGICVIIINLNDTTLMEQMGTDQEGLGWAVSGMGIGKLAVMLFGGALSDKFGRKVFIAIGMFGFIGFFVGILYSTSVSMAFAFSVLCGMSNSFIDSSGMPALMECFPNAYGSASIMVKAFVSLGQVFMPVLVNYIAANGHWWGLAFIACAIVMGLNGLFLLTRKFPDFRAKPTDTGASGAMQAEKPRMFPEGICFSVIGFTSTASFTILLLKYNQFGREAAGMDEASANLLVSYFGVGSILAVFATAFMVKSWIKSVYFVFFYPAIAALVLLFLYLHPTQEHCRYAAYVLGFTAGGGVLQLNLAAMAELFTFGKGKVTSIVYTLNNISIFAVPPLVGYLSTKNVSDVILFDVVMCCVGALLAAVIIYRYRKIYPTMVSDRPSMRETA